MSHNSSLRIDPETLAGNSSGKPLEIVIPYTEWSLARETMRRAVALTAGLNATLALVAVHTLPFPAPIECPGATHAHLVSQVIDVATQFGVPVQAKVVLSRGRKEGLESVLTPESTVLIGSRRRPWRTAEESLSRMLVRDGYQVALLHVG